MTKAARIKLTVSGMENQHMMLSDYIGKNHHYKYGTPGWNVSKVDSSIKFVRSKEAYSYVLSNDDIWNSWNKGATIREFLLS